MIGDLIVDARLRFTKLSDVIQLPESLGDTGVPINVTGKYCITGRRAVTTSDDVLPLGDIGTIGWVALKNLGGPLIDAAGAPSVANIGSAGSTTVSYKIVSRQADGGYTIASSAGTTTTANSTMDGSNFNRLTWTAVDNAASYDVYRTAAGGTPSTTGLIGNVTSPTIDDTGLAGDGSTAPSTTPYNFDIEVGSDGTLYPILLRGGDRQVVRWHAAAIHHKAFANGTDIGYLIIEA